MSFYKSAGASEDIFSLGTEKACGPNNGFNLCLRGFGHFFWSGPTTKQGWGYHVDPLIRALSRENGRNNEFEGIPEVQGARCCRKGQSQRFYDGFSPLLLRCDRFPSRDTHGGKPFAICVVLLGARIHIKEKIFLERNSWKMLQQRTMTLCISRG